MPIIDIELVCSSDAEFRAVSAAALANALGEALHTEPGRVWVRLRLLKSTCYAENSSALSETELPTFVTVQHAVLPVGAALAAEAKLLTDVIANAMGRSGARVHVQYAPPGADRQAFGGRFVHGGV